MRALLARILANNWRLITYGYLYVAVYGNLEGPKRQRATFNFARLSREIIRVKR